MTKFLAEVKNLGLDILIPGRLKSSTHGKIVELRENYPDVQFSDSVYAHLESSVFKYGEIAPLVVAGLWAINSTVEVLHGNMDLPTAVGQVLGMYAIAKLPSRLIYKNLVLPVIEEGLRERIRQTTIQD